MKLNADIIFERLSKEYPVEMYGQPGEKLLLMQPELYIDKVLRFYENHVYIAMPPLYKAIPSRGEAEYLYDDAALDRYRKKHKGPFTLQRYKGLGEMDPDQLWETTLNPQTRTLKLVEIEDAKMASDVTGMLMGSDVPPRKAFIYEHAREALLDI